MCPHVSVALTIFLFLIKPCRLLAQYLAGCQLHSDLDLTQTHGSTFELHKIISNS